MTLLRYLLVKPCKFFGNHDAKIKTKSAIRKFGKFKTSESIQPESLSKSFDHHDSNCSSIFILFFIGYNVVVYILLCVLGT